MKKNKGILVIFMVVGTMLISAEIVKGQTRTREQKKTRVHTCDQDCDPDCTKSQDQLRDQKQDQLREQKQDGS